MAKKRKICAVVTARPSYARIKTALAAIRDHPDLELQLVVAASALLDRYGSTIDTIRAEGFEPDAEVYMVVEGENLVTSVKSTGMGIVEFASIFDRLKPDAVLSVADRYETIATAIAGSYMNIPVVHVQGGEVSGSIDEKVRHAVSKLADLHLVSNAGAAERLRRMGERPDSIHVTGCPSIDLAAAVANDGGQPDVSFMHKGVGAEFDPQDGYLIVMQHPVTYEWESALQQVTETLEAIIEYGFPTYWFWPNVDAGADALSRGIRKFREKSRLPNVHFLKNMPPEEFLRVLIRSRCIVGNSSVGVRESAFLGVPSVNIGTRQRGRDRGRNLVDVGHERGAIRDAISRQVDQGHYEPDHIYGDGGAGARIADRLATEPLTIDKRISY